MEYMSPEVRDLLGVRVLPMAERPDAGRWQGDEVYELAWLFSTRDGSWEVTNKPAGITPEARARWLRPPADAEYCAGGGGDHHLFCAVLGADGKLMRGKGVLYWSDGLAALANPGYDGWVQGRDGRRLPETDGRGWVDQPVNDYYVPDRGEVGPWCMAPFGLADVVVGLGMPWKWHVSFFGIWQARPREDGGTPPGPGESGAAEVLAGLLEELRGLRAEVGAAAGTANQALAGILARLAGPGDGRQSGDGQPAAPTAPPYALLRPLPEGVGAVTQWFGARPEAYAPEYAGHPGLDYGAPLGTPVLAAHGGRAQVVNSGSEGYGLHVRLVDAASGMGTLYAHLSAVEVADGASVAAGARLGRVGSTGRSTGPHLHFAWWVTGVHNPAYQGYLDPVLGRNLAA